MALGLHTNPSDSVDPPSPGRARERHHACVVFSSQDYVVLHYLIRGLRHIVRPSWSERRGLRIFYLCHRNCGPGPTDGYASWPTFASNMDRSNKLILMASPESARSPYVCRELNEWFETRSADDVVIVHTRGGWTWDTEACDFGHRRTSSAINQALLGRFSRRPPIFDMTWAPVERNRRLPGRAQYFDLLGDVAAAVVGCDRTDIVVDLPPPRWPWWFLPE